MCCTFIAAAHIFEIVEIIKIMTINLKEEMFCMYIRLKCKRFFVCVNNHAIHAHAN